MRAFLLVVLLAGTAFAQPGGFFNTSPKPLAASHAALDDASHCNDCHINGTKDVSNQKCLDCHDHHDLRDRIAANKGFHATSRVKGKPCITCHKEHRDRSFDLMGWGSVPGGQDRFDHALTGWPLAGKHGTTACRDCHKAKNKQGLVVYMNTDRTCGTCHAKNQPHKLVRPALLACDRCHTESVWKPWKTKLAFDHDDRNDAAMPLLGAHAPLVRTCAKCHPKSVFKLPNAEPAACGNAGCHVSPHDKHLFGTRKCEWCHSPTDTKLRDIKFDHSGRTRFDLGPRHQQLGCYSCHTKALGESKPKMTCAQQGCHAKDNKHGQRFNQFGDPPACEVCHPSGGLKFTPVVFNHGRTTFPLQAKHAKATCRDCHRGSGPTEFARMTPACKDCHRHATVHASPKYPKGRWESGKCLKCHPRPGDKAMRDQKELEREFHGVGSDFPLVKKHRGLDCGLCHTNRAKTKGTSFDDDESPECGDRCHEDSLHKSTLGKTCTNCHQSGTWEPFGFDHDKPFPADAKGVVKAYPLVGGHRKAECVQCHPQKKFSEAPATCSAVGCHAEDDAHKGRLGTACEQCHVPTGDVLFNHNTMSKFRLDGKHLKVRCADCHPSITFKPRPSTCFGCHPEPTVHKGQYGTGCQQCHTTRTWEDIKPLHDVGDFSLKGSHNNLACERCHRDNRPLAGSGNLCINCHRQDDIHNNSLSPRCGECHSQWSFAPARFDHGRVGCNLTGLHRTMACFDCHKNGNFTALSPQCASCHHDDDKRAGLQQMVQHGAQTVCASCHNPNSWRPAQTTFSFGRESVCR